MKFWVDIQYVGSINQLDSLVKKLGYHKEEVCLLTNAQDVEPIYDHFGKPGKMAGILDFGGFFVVARDGDYELVYGFRGSIPYITKDLYEIKWKMVTQREYSVLTTRFARYPHRECPSCKQHAIDHSARKDGFRWVVACPERREVSRGETTHTR